MATHRSGASFAIAIDQWCKKANKSVDKATRAITFEIFGRVIRRTPVDTGAARTNWQVGINQMPAGIVTGSGDAVGIMKSALGEGLAGKVIYLVNNLPYIGVLEYGGYPNPPKGGEGKTVGGFSKQAPAGMVRVTVQEVSDAVNKAISETDNGS
jgi:hypothetical protein